MIEGNLTNMFTDVNDKVGTIAAEVGQTPSAWNNSIYMMIRGLSETVIIPIAGIIITFVLCYELISMITEKNNLHDMDTWMFFKWFFKAAVAIYLVTNTFDIVMAIFDIGQNGISRLPDHDLRRYLCSSHQQHDYRSQHPLGTLFRRSIHSHPVLLAVQVRDACEIAVQCPLRKEDSNGICTGPEGS